MPEELFRLIGVYIQTHIFSQLHVPILPPRFRLFGEYYVNKLSNPFLPLERKSKNAKEVFHFQTRVSP